MPLQGYHPGRECKDHWSINVKKSRSYISVQSGMLVRIGLNSVLQQQQCFNSSA